MIAFIKSLFSGRKKLFTLPIGILIGLFFLPLTILLIIAYLIYAKVGNIKLKIIALFIVGVFILFFGTAYISALVNPTGRRPGAKTAVSSTPSVSSSLLSTSTPNPLNLEFVKVERVIDGDTITLAGGKVVRYIGIDTPEIVDPRKPVQCYAKEASARNKALVEGQMVGLEKDVSETDKYNRLLRYVYKDNVLINELLVREGFAYSSSYPPDIKYQDKFKQAENEARNAQRGLWGKICLATPVPVKSPVATPIQTQTSVVQDDSQGGGNPVVGAYTCNCSKTCANLSCEEAQYQLNSCGCSARDADHDGIACDSQCQ